MSKDDYLKTFYILSKCLSERFHQAVPPPHTRRHFSPPSSDVTVYQTATSLKKKYSHLFIAFIANEVEDFNIPKLASFINYIFVTLRH